MRFSSAPEGEHKTIDIYSNALTHALLLAMIILRLAKRVLLLANYTYQLIETVVI
jgi:hypothetical protein